MHPDQLEGLEKKPKFVKDDVGKCARIDLGDKGVIDCLIIKLNIKMENIQAYIFFDSSLCTISWDQITEVADHKVSPNFV